MLNSHLFHFGTRGKAHFETGNTRAASFLARPDRILDGVCILVIHVRIVIGYFDDLLAIELGVLHVLGQFLNCLFVQIHRLSSPARYSGRIVIALFQQIQGNILDHVFLTADGLTRTELNQNLMRRHAVFRGSSFRVQQK